MTAVGVSLIAASSASAQTPPPAPSAGARAQELYRAGDFSGALPLFEEAHRAEPANFDYEWGLAQSLRQTSQCDKALLHYQALREAAPDPKTARDVRDQMALCPGGAIEEEPPPPPPPTTTAVVEVSGRSGGATTKTWLMAAGAGAGIGLSVVFFLDYRASNDAAEAAARFDDHEKFSARADRMLIGSGVAAVIGVGLAVISIRRFKHEHRTAEVAIVPRADGGAVVWSGSW
ncbi:MAG TPA: tetratricopeptide repeat protein [Kofleriaceae bacterium]|nr:tetratricopeptide repeat protein [Kofleriaceae bacterium]